MLFLALPIGQAIHLPRMDGTNRPKFTQEKIRNKQVLRICCFFVVVRNWEVFFCFDSDWNVANGEKWESDARGTWISKMLLVNSHVTSCAEFLHRNHDARPNQRDIWKPWMSNKSRHIQLDSLGNDTRKNTHSTSRCRPHRCARMESEMSLRMGRETCVYQHLLLKTTWFSNRANLPYHGTHASCHRIGWRKSKSDFLGVICA